MNSTVTGLNVVCFVPLIMQLLILAMAIEESEPKDFFAMKRSNKTFVGFFFAPWCGHCKAFKPHVEAAQLKLKDEVPILAFDCTKDSNHNLCSQMGVNGYPTIKIFNHNGKRKAALDYQGERTEEPFIQWIREHKRADKEL